MKNKKSLLVFLGIIIILLFFFYIIRCKCPFFSDSVSKMEILMNILNLILGGGLIFSFYKWKTDRDFKEQDDFIKYFDELYFKARILLKEENLQYLSDNGYTPEIISNFVGITINGNNIIPIINKNDKIFNNNFLSNYPNIISNSNITEGLIDLYELVNYIIINERIIKKSIILQNFLKNKLKLFRNINFFYGLFILHINYSKISLTNNSSKKGLEGKLILEVNNKDIINYIKQLNNNFKILSKYL